MRGGSGGFGGFIGDAVGGGGSGDLSHIWGKLGHFKPYGGGGGVMDGGGSEMGGI